MLGPSSNNTTVFDIKSLQSAVGECKDSLLFLHAVTGCNTTSALYNQGKKKAYKLLKKHTGLAKDVSIFNMPQAAKKDLNSAGEKFLLHWYGASDFTLLDAFRYYAFTCAIAKKSAKDSFNLTTLPPTSAAANSTSSVPISRSNSGLARSWSLQTGGGGVYMDTLIPVPTDQPTAPERLLYLVSCKCKTGCSRGCGCRRVGALCSPMCTNCMGITCTNTGRDSEVYTDDIYMGELVHNRTTKHVIPFSLYIGTVWYVPSWAINGLRHVIVSHH